MSGTLFVVATPIGNLEDLTFRALRTLREVDLIAAEDTRRTSKLLAHYDVRKSLVSLREHNEAKQGGRLVAELEAGKNIAMVSDAGTPGIADPGARFVHLAREHKIKVVPIPGCSAIATALSASGVSGDEFVFAGFAPAGSQRENWSNNLISEPRTIIYFDTPHSVGITISHIASKLAKRPIIAWRELTKIHEQAIEIAGDTPMPFDSRGEFVVVIGPKESSPRRRDWAPEDAPNMTDLFDYMTNYPAVSEAEALRFIAAKYGVEADDVRKAIKKQKILVKQHNNLSD